MWSCEPNKSILNANKLIKHILDVANSVRPKLWGLLAYAAIMKGPSSLKTEL